MAIEFSETVEAALQHFMREQGITERESAIVAIVSERLEAAQDVKVEEASPASDTGVVSDAPDPEEVQYPSYFKGKGSI